MKNNLPSLPEVHHSRRPTMLWVWGASHSGSQLLHKPCKRPPLSMAIWHIKVTFHTCSLGPKLQLDFLGWTRVLFTFSLNLHYNPKYNIQAKEYSFFLEDHIKPNLIKFEQTQAHEWSNILVLSPRGPSKSEAPLNPRSLQIWQAFFNTKISFKSSKL